MGALLLLIAFMIASFSEAGKATWIGIMLSGFGLSIMFVHPRIELDFVKNRFRTYMLFATATDFKEIPKLDRIQVRDITYKGGRTSSIPGSWGDTYSYEVFLMSVANEKLVVCERPSKAAIREIVGELNRATGLPIRDVTKEQVLNEMK
ncbi:MAG: hypothetical protein JST38_19915 [Bacteroidetes bacterium]|nr:hypothetical protein [Bacteroidota bacterium]MBS1943137.1 hypothetical protein [Bacteroidota bacterium]